MAWSWRKLDPKLAKKPSPTLGFCHFSFSPPPSLPLPPSFQPPIACPPTTPTHVISATANRPLSRLEQPSFLSLSHLCKILLFPVINSGHRSSQRRCPNHQLNLLITAVTTASGSVLFRSSPSSAIILVARRMWTIVQVLQIINILGGMDPFQLA